MFFRWSSRTTLNLVWQAAATAFCFLAHAGEASNVGISASSTVRIVAIFMRLPPLGLSANRVPEIRDRLVQWTASYHTGMAWEQPDGRTITSRCPGDAHRPTGRSLRKNPHTFSKTEFLARGEVWVSTPYPADC